jgi:hypothetical protein
MHSDGTAHRLSRMKDRYRPRAILDDNFRSRAHVGQERRHIGCGGFFFGDVDHVLSHNEIMHCYFLLLFFGLRESREPIITLRGCGFALR